MKRNTKILIGILAVLLIIFLVYRTPKSGLEKSVIKNKVAKVTREPIVGKEPFIEFMAKATEGKIPFVDNKQIQHKYDENKTISSEKNLVVKWETLENPKMEDIVKLNHAYASFIEEYADARYFKPDINQFKELFKKKVGDEVTLVIDGEEFHGHITKAEIEEPLEMEKKQGANYLGYSFYIQPIGEDLDDPGDIINIGGLIFLDTGEVSFEGDIDYTRTNGGIMYRYDFNNKIGVIIPYDRFDSYLDAEYYPNKLYLEDPEYQKVSRNYPNNEDEGNNEDEEDLEKKFLEYHGLTKEN